MTDSLFSEIDLDPEMIEIERRQMEREKALAKKETVEVKEELPFDKKVYILDGYSIIYRSYFAHITSPIKDKDGKNISAFFGFFTTLLSILSNYEMDYLAVTMDEREPTFRHKMYPEYKANRDKAPDDLHAQVPMIIETLGKMNIPVLSRAGFEADDVIASLTKKATEEGIESIMVTGDKDLCQLIGGHIFALRPPKKGENKYNLFSSKEVKEAYGVTPEQIVDYLSILGDASDNVPGIKGIGEKGAVKLLTEYLSFDGIYRHLDSLSPSMQKKLIEGREAGELSRKLVRLSFDAIDDGFDFSSIAVSRIDRKSAAADFEAKGFKRLVTAALSGSGQSRKAFVENAEPVLENNDILTEAEKKTMLGNGSYEMISSDDIKAKLKTISEFGSGALSLEILTDGYEDDAPIIGVAFSSELKKAFFIPVKDGGEAKRVLAAFGDTKLKIVFQNAKYVIKKFWNNGLELASIPFDTMVAAWMLDSNAGVYALEDLSLRYLSQTAMRLGDIVSKDEKLSELPLDILTRYAAERADLTFRLYRILERRLYERELTDSYFKLELPLIRILASMEREGIYLSEDRMDAINAQLSGRLSQLVDSIYSLAGHEFNINSTMQLGKVLFEERGLPVGKKTQRGYSTDTATLEGLKGVGDPIVDYILEYRQLAKLKSTYIDTLPLLRDENGRIHTSFLQTGTATGRLSSRNPNLQNIPVRTDEGRLIRSAFIPKDGYVFLSADYSQIELVVLAYMTDDPGLTEAFRTGEDVHRYTASIIFSKDVKDVTPNERRISKTINFGIMYGMSAFRLSNELGITRGEAAEFIKTYFDRYAGVKAFVEKTNEDARAKGFVKTEFGHIREVLGINSSNKTERAAAERVAVNTVIQGTAAEIMKKAMIDIYKAMKENNLASRILLQVHDELIFEVKAEEKEEMEALVRSAMENAVKLTVPIRASLEFGFSWGDMH